MQQRFYRGFARVHHAVMVRTGGRPGWLTPQLRILVLTTTGHRSGQARRATLAYMPDRGGYIVLATNFGAETDPAWYHNLLSEPEASVTIAGRSISVHADVLRGPERDRMVEVARHHNSQWRYYMAHTSREIPVIRLVPGAARRDPGS